MTVLNGKQSKIKCQAHLVFREKNCKTHTDEGKKQQTSYLLEEMTIAMTGIEMFVEIHEAVIRR